MISIVYSDELRAYMDKKGMRDVLIAAYQAKCCCGSMSEQDVKLIGAKEAQSLRDKNANYLKGELGDVFVGVTRVPQGDATIELDIQRHPLGIVDITVEGLLPLKAF